jgi:mannose-6-phosphate isomerase
MDPTQVTIPTEQPTVDLVRRPWGNQAQFVNNGRATVSLMTVDPGQRLSLQSHTGRAELWVVLDEGAAVQIGDEVQHTHAGDRVWIPSGAKHRLSSTGPTVRVLEIAFGDWQQSDITRYDDDYNRPHEGD